MKPGITVRKPGLYGNGMEENFLDFKFKINGKQLDQKSPKQAKVVVKRPGSLHSRGVRNLNEDLEE